MSVVKPNKFQIASNATQFKYKLEPILMLCKVKNHHFGLNYVVKNQDLYCQDTRMYNKPK